MWSGPGVCGLKDLVRFQSLGGLPYLNMSSRLPRIQQRIPLRIGTAIGPGSLSLPIHARNRQEQHPAQRVTGLDSLDIENI